MEEEHPAGLRINIHTAFHVVGVESGGATFQSLSIWVGVVVVEIQMESEI